MSNIFIVDSITIVKCVLMWSQLGTSLKDILSYDYQTLSHLNVYCLIQKSSFLASFAPWLFKILEHGPRCCWVFRTFPQPMISKRIIISLLKAGSSDYAFQEFSLAKPSWVMNYYYYSNFIHCKNSDFQVS